MSQFWETQPQSDHLTHFLFTGRSSPNSDPKFLFSGELSDLWFVAVHLTEHTELFLYVSTRLCYQAVLHIPELWVNSAWRWEKKLSCFSRLCNEPLFSLHSPPLGRPAAARSHKHAECRVFTSENNLSQRVRARFGSGCEASSALCIYVFICLWECFGTARQHSVWVFFIFLNFLHAF